MQFDPRVAKIPWRSAWLPTPVFLPGESHGQRSLVGYQGGKESDTTEVTYSTAHGFLGKSKQIHMFASSCPNNKY